MFTKTKFFAIIFVMKQTNTPATGNGRSPKKSFLDQPRKAVSGMIYSGAIIGMLLISLVFSVTVAVLSRSLGMTVNEISQTQAYRYCSYLLYQIVYIGIIAAFMGIYKEKPAQFGWRKTHPKYYLIGIVLLFGLMFSLNYVNNWFVAFLGLFGYTMPESSLPSLAGGGIVGVLFVVAVLPAVLEETLFRGVILEGIKDCGTVAACLLGGLLFCVFHQSPAQTVYQFICGAAFTLLAIRAQSLLPTVMMHFLNNAVIILDAKFKFLENLPTGGQIAVYVVSAVCLLASLAWLIFAERTQSQAESAGQNKMKREIGPFMYPALPGILLCVLMWVLNLANGLGG